MQKPHSANSRFNELDLLRFLAAIAVVLYHWTFRGAAQRGLTSFSIPEFAPWVKYGYLGVDLFFILSGFVILLSIQGKGPIEFVISRFTRLYPAFWTCCTVTFLVCWFAGEDRFPVTLPQFFANLTMFNFYMRQDNIDGVYWTLMEEMKFYGFVFVLLCCRQSHRIETFLQAWLVASLVCFISQRRELMFLVSARWSGHFIAGATYFLISRSGLTPRRVLLLLTAVSYSTFMAASSATMLTERYHANFDPLVISSLVVSFHALFFAVSQGWTQFSSKAFRVLGNLTYPLYLLHQNIGYLALDLFARTSRPILALMGVTGAALLAAWAVYFLVERNMNHRLKSWLEARFVRTNAVAEPLVLPFGQAGTTALTEMCVWLSNADAHKDEQNAA
ncbi:MAG: acyltransferase [Planctomycetia bacterium]|nr:acyltransferase [Planctomycetia bacterium]